jgi:hypothetical protein
VRLLSVLVIGALVLQSYQLLKDILDRSDFHAAFFKRYEGGGALERARSGLTASMMMTVIRHLTQTAGTPIPPAMAVQRVVVGTLEHIVFAVILARLSGTKPPAR